MLPTSLTLEQAIKLYYQKHYLLQQNNLVPLIALKRQYPDIFTTDFDASISHLINYIKQHYSETPKPAVLQWSVINNEEDTE